VSFINSRLRKLEERISGGGPCPECEGGPVRFNVVYGDEESSANEVPEEFCAECGRPLWTIIKVVYDGDEAKPGGGGL
jgi:hypothetical protein